MRIVCPFLLYLHIQNKFTSNKKNPEICVKHNKTTVFYKTLFFSSRKHETSDFSDLCDLFTILLAVIVSIFKKINEQNMIFFKDIFLTVENCFKIVQHV